MKAINIDWDTDGNIEIPKEFLPKEIEIPETLKEEEEISEYISDKTGFCHFGFQLVDCNTQIISNY